MLRRGKGLSPLAPHTHPRVPSANLRFAGREAVFIPSADDITRYLLPKLSDGDVVVAMSNGAFGGVHEKLLQALKMRGKG